LTEPSQPITWQSLLNQSLGWY